MSERKLKIYEVLPELEIGAGDEYKAEDFVKACKDNSNQKCIIEFITSDTDENGDLIYESSSHCLTSDNG